MESKLRWPDSGVEIFARAIHPQRHRDCSANLHVEMKDARRIALWPQQWSAVWMFAQTAKGFIHPRPKDVSPNEWFQRLFSMN